jgi:integrase
MRVPKYRKHSSGRAFAEHQGKRHYFPGKFESAESRAAYAELLTRALTRPATEKTSAPKRAASLTLMELCLAWLDHLGGAEDSSAYYNAKALTQVIAREAPAELVADFSPKRLLALREHFVAERRDHQGTLLKRAWGRAYVNSQTHHLRRIIRWGVEQELVTACHLDALGAVSGLRKGRTTAADPKQIKPADLRTVAAITRAAPLTLATMIRTQLRTGMRSHHLCALRVIDIDMSRDVWVYTPRRHLKGNAKELRILIGPKTQRMLAPLLDRDELAYLFNPRESAAQRNRTPHPAVREHYDSGTYRQAIQHVADRLGIAPFHPHQLRHSAGTRARRELGLETAQAVLGHDRIDVTQIYAEKHLALAEEYAKRFG